MTNWFLSSFLMLIDCDFLSRFDSRFYNRCWSSDLCLIEYSFGLGLWLSPPCTAVRFIGVRFTI